MKVSIVIPLYNGERYLAKCMESILLQDYHDYEVVIIDDGSADSSLEIARQYESERVHVFTQDNAGPSVTRNVGIAKCSLDSHCVFFVDCDDSITPSYLSTLLMEYNPMRQNFPFCEIASIRESQNLPFIEKRVSYKTQTFKKYWANEEFLKLFIRGLINSSCNKCYSLDILRRHSIRFANNYPEDITFNLEYLKYISEVTYIPVALYYYIKRDGSITSKAYTELYDGYISIQKELYTCIPVSLHEYVNEYVYPQYLANTRLFMQNGDFSTPISYLKNQYIKKAINMHKPTCTGDLLIKKLLQYRLLRVLDLI